MRRLSIISILISLFTLLLGAECAQAQTRLNAGGSLASGSYIIKEGNLTITTPIKIEKDQTVTIDLNGYVLKGDFSNGGTVITVEDGGKLTIKDSRPTLGHEGYINSDGLFVWPRGSASNPYGVGGGIITNTLKSGKSTKGIAVSGTCIVECAKIMGCYTDGIGAAVTVTSSGSFTMKAGEISYNYSASTTEDTHGARAGAIYGEPSHNNSGSLLDFSNTTISHNKSGGNGGAICGYNVKLDNCTVEYNTTTHNGGAVYVRRDNDSNNDASLTITSSQIKYNSAADNGGAIYSEDGSKITISGRTDISWNKATNTGGGIFSHAPLEITGTAAVPVVIEMNEAKNGGGIRIYTKAESKYAVPTCKIQYCNLDHNWAYGNGGGIYSSVETSIANSTINGNRAMSSESEGQETITNWGRGGGFYFSGTADELGLGPNFVIQNTEVTDNAAMYYGGGGQVCNGAIFTLKTGGVINENISVLHGAGGLHLTGSARFIFEDGEISENIAHSVGGGIHSSYTCELNLTGGAMRNNIVYGRGGGVHVNTGGNVVLQGTIIEGNESHNGYDYKYSDVSRDETTGIVSWTPQKYVDPTPVLGYGGGVVIDSGTCEMNAGELAGNWAQAGGGGIALVMINMSVNNLEAFKQIKVVNFALNSGEIINNTTDGDGAGVYLMRNRSRESLEKIKGSTVYDEIIADTEFAPSILNGIPKIIISSGTIHNNIAEGDGGGAFQEENTEFLISGESAKVYDNEAKRSGGAVYISQGTATVEGGKIYDNKAAEYGGAIYVNGSLTVSNGLVTGNEATNGGGLCVFDGEVKITKGTISENRASNFGGGLYVYNNNATNQQSVTFDGGTFSNNSAFAGGGACVEGNIKLAMSADLENNTAKNGGGVYLRGGSVMEFGAGMIRNNVAESSDDTGVSGNKYIDTGYNITLPGSGIQGLGGGIYLDTGSSLSFTDNEHLGLYGNQAYNGADDIFANGNGTSVQLPDVSKMLLSDFRVPVDEGNLYWVKDYVTNDTKYDQAPLGTDGVYDEVLSNPLSNSRYRYSLSNLKDKAYYKLDPDTYTGYVSVALGYEVIYVTVKKIGLIDGDSAIIKISKIEGETATPYMTFTMSAENSDKDSANTLSKKLALPAGTWRVEEISSWSWAYDIDGDSSYVREITQSTTDKTFTFTNKEKQKAPKLRDEAVKVNIFQL